MPYFRKEALSKYISTMCKRQLRLYLTPDNAAYRAERIAEGMPPVQPPRPGLEQIIQAGEEWEAAKVADLAQTFGTAAIVGNSFVHRTGQTRYQVIDLAAAIKQAAPGKFLAQAEYPIGASFQKALGIDGFGARFNLSYANVRPDIIEVLPAGHLPRFVRADGDVWFLPAGDTRLQVRVIDVKLTAEPSPPYFAEVTYYAMALAGWLEDAGLDGQFVVVPEASVWPGSHDASKLIVAYRECQRQGITPTHGQLRTALEQDLEPVPFEAFSFRLQRFFREELPDVLDQSWNALPFHVDNRCRGCEFLGYPWVNAQGQRTDHQDHCMPTALRQDHLSRVAFITRGASAVLQDQGIANVAALSQRGPEDKAFSVHHELRAGRTVVSGRAKSLLANQAHIPPSAGTSAVMPRWTDLRVFLSADFDVGSAITFAFGLEAFWLEPRPFGSTNTTQRQTKGWRQTLIIDQKDLHVEERELLALLGEINNILTWARTQNPATTVQFYVWDTLQYEHLTRVIGRHLQAILRDRSLQHLAWLFPPPELLPNAAMATRRSPLTIVKDVIRALLAAPIPHYYSLLQIARVYHHNGLDPKIAAFTLHPLYEDALSDQIPSERAHEIWSRATTPRHWQQQMRVLDESVRKRLTALSTVTRRLGEDLGKTLSQTAPPINIQPPPYKTGVSADGQLWYAYAKLNEALSELEVQHKRAMPPHEREARFDSARLRRRLSGQAEAAALRSLNVQPAAGRMVYEMRPESREVKLREGDFSFAVSPELDPGFLDKRFLTVAQGTWLQPTGPSAFRQRMEDVLGVTVVAVDREKGLIALDPSRRALHVDPNGRIVSTFEALESLGLADFSKHAILDPTFHDFFTDRLLRTLQAIGNPPKALASPLVQQATGQSRGRGARPTRHTPPADLLWDAVAMHAARVARNTAPARAELVAHGRTLNPTQWLAWEEALTRRLQLIWGPPGTGKSRTVTSIILGAALEAAQQGRPIRILLSAFTYTAIDNVLSEVYREVHALLPKVAAGGIHRIRSYLAPRPERPLDAIDLELNARHPSQAVQDLWDRLWRATDTTIVGATPQQVHNLLVMNGGSPQQELFDLIVIDEASQMDVALSILALSSISDGGSVVLAGDPLQLAPIHKAEPPLGLENRVGSIYTYCADANGVPAIMLDENYRSNSTLVDFARDAGYRAGLSAYSPDLRLDLLAPVPTAQPTNWPAGLYWTPEWAALLDPDHPAVCYVYVEGRSSQSNPFEADAVAALAWLLYGRLADQLANERDPATGVIKVAPTRRAYGPTGFWERGLGVVTPHRAQEGLIIERLRDAFATTPPHLIRGAVDTVERFQGQERDVVIASFALGDPDAIFREDEFLLSLNRFNVLASRARAKLVVFVSQEVVDHLSGDIETLRESRLLKLYAQSFCSSARSMTLGHVVNGCPKPVPGVFRHH